MNSKICIQVFLNSQLIYKKVKTSSSLINRIFFEDKSPDNFNRDIIQIIMDTLNIEIITKENLSADLLVISEMFKKYYGASIKYISPSQTGISVEIIFSLLENLFLFSDYQLIMNLEKAHEHSKTEIKKDITESPESKEPKESKDEKKKNCNSKGRKRRHFRN